MSKRNILLSIIAVVAVLLLGSTNVWSATITSAQTGNWNTTTTWVGGVVPTATDDVVIAAGHTVTADVAPTVVNLTVNGTLQPDNNTDRTLTINGNLTVSSTGTIQGQGTGDISLSFSAINANISLETGSSVTIENLTIAATATNVTWAGSATISGVLTVAAGGKLTQTSGTTTLSYAGAAVVNTSPNTYDNLTLYNVTTTAAVTTATPWTIAGNLNASSGSFTAGTPSTIVFKNNATPNNAKSISGTVSFFNLLIDDGSYVTTGSNFSITGGSFEVVGSGSFKATGTSAITFATTAATITTSSLSTCEFMNVVFNIGTTTTSNFTVKGNVTESVAGNALIASAPSTITFENTAAKTITSTTNNDFTFNNIVVKNGSTVQNSGAYDVTIKGDITVENGATLNMANANAETILGDGTTKNIVNYGTLTFYDLTIEDVLNNVVQTESDFTVTNTFSSGGTNGTFLASGNSTITFTGTTPLASTTQANCSFQNVKFTGAAAFAANSFSVKGDFYSSSNTTQTSASTVTFNGTSQQKILSDGSSSIQLGTLILDNPQGLKLFENITLNTTGAATITFTNGNIDLNGSYTITMSGAAPQISGETYDKTFVNTGIGAGAITTGAISKANAEAAGLGVSSTTGPTANLTIARYLDSKIINGVPTVKRYYSILSSAGAITGATLAYFNNQLNGNTDSKLWAYATRSATASTIAITDPPATTWLQMASAVTTGTNSGTIAISSTSLAATFTHYIAFRNREVELESWPTTGVHNDLALETMPLVAGSTTTATDNDASTDIILARFAITPYFTLADALTQIKATLSQSVSGIISNLYLVEDTDLSDATVDDIVAGTISGTTVTFTIPTGGSEDDLTALTTRYFYIAGTVTNSVTSATQNITITIAPSDITIANCDITGSAQSSPTISFTGQNVSVNVNNTPLSKPVMQGSSANAIFGFTLTPPNSSTSITLQSVKIKANLTDGATSSDFNTFQLYSDDNKDGVPDGGQIGSNASINSSGYVIFSSLGHSFTGEKQFLVRCNVASGATVGGRIQLVIESSADITLASPALVTSGGPYDGGTFTVSSSSLTPTKLVVTSFGMDNYASLATDLPEKTGREVVSGEPINITIEAQDANGNPANVDAGGTGISITVTSGTATVANGTATIAGSTASINWGTFTLTNALGYGPITITVTPTSGMTTLTPATYTNIVIYAQEPTTQASTLAEGTVTSTTIPLTWVRGNGDGLIVVAREGSWPVKPTDGVVYDQVPGNNFTSTSGSGNYFTGTGSVVVYKGTGTSATITGLTPGKTYYLAAYEYKGGATANSKPNYLLSTTTYSNELIVSTPSAAPTVAASGVTFGQVTTSSIKVNWTNGDGAKRIVVALAGGAPTPVIADGNDYTANSAYGDPATANGDGFVVYNGNANTFTMTNLLPGTTYHFAVYEYNGSGVYTNYIATAATGNRQTLAAQPTIQAHSIDIQPVSNTSLKVTWVNGNGEGRVLLGKVDEAISNADFPLDQGAALTESQTFGSGTASGDAYVLSTTTPSPVTVTGLEFGKTYYFRVFEYNGTAGAYTSSTVNYLTSTATNNPNYGVSDADEPANNTMLTAKYYGTANGTLVDGILSNASDVDWYSVEPNVDDGYKYLRIKLLNLPRNYTIELYDEDGRRLRSSKFTGTTDEVIVINNLPVGVYYIKVYSEDGDFSITPYRVSAMESELEYKSETP